MWIDPTSHSFVIVLTNAVHPKRGHSLSSFRSRLATTVAAGFGLQTQDVSLTGYNETITGAGVHRVIDRNAATMTGLDVLEANGFADLKGKRIGLITNHTGLDRSGRRNIDAMRGRRELRLLRSFRPSMALAALKTRKMSPTVPMQKRGFQLLAFISRTGAACAPSRC